MDDVLKYLAEVVTEWPNDDRTHVRLDKDGEVCFECGGVIDDFYPGVAFGGVWAGGDGSRVTGHKYTFAEWKEARERLSEPVGDIEWSPWIEHDGSDECPEGVEDLPCCIKQGYGNGNIIGESGKLRGLIWGWSPVTHYRIPMEDYRRITGMPPSSEIPSPANWIAQRDDGRWVAYKEKPQLVGNCEWATASGDQHLLNFGKVLGDWRDTLQELPDKREAPVTEYDLLDPCSTHADEQPMTDYDTVKMTVTADWGDELYSADVIRGMVKAMNIANGHSDDKVNAPRHYASGEIECIDAIRASMSEEEFEGYCKGNVQKYMWRWRDKGGVESLRKAEWYLRKLISVLE